MHVCFFTVPISSCTGYLLVMLICTHRKVPFLQWEECDALPTAMGRGFAVCIGDSVYMGGGVYFVQNPIPMPTFDAECSVFKYDCRNNKWNTLPIVNIHKFGMAEYKERLVLIGGASRRKRPWDTLEYSKRLIVWDETTHNWISPYPEMKTARMQPTSVGYGDALVVAGGENASYLSDVEVMYDSGDDKFEWTQVSPLPASISRATSALSGGTWYLMGGLKQSTAVYHINLDSLVQEALSKADQTDDAVAPSIWKTIPDTKRKHAAVAVLGNSVLSIGGTKAGTIPKAENRVFTYIDVMNTWIETQKPLPHPLTHTVPVALSSGELLVVGGFMSRPTFRCSSSVYRVSFT